MTTRNIDVMLSRPGIYCVATWGGIGFVEVEPDGKVHQLELRSGTYARDGELRPGGWCLENIAGIEGPFGRAP